MGETDPVSPRSGWSWGGCVVLAVIVVVLAGLFLPLVRQVKIPARHASCGRNQSQIVSAMVAYASAEGTAWPDPRGKAAWKIPAGPIITALDGAMYTAGAFELLASSQSISSALFKCPTASFGGPRKTREASLDGTTVQWGWDPRARLAVSHGFDWASPPNPGSTRLTLADREIGTHGGSVMIAF